MITRREMIEILELIDRCMRGESAWADPPLPIQTLALVEGLRDSAQHTPPCVRYALFGVENSDEAQSSDVLVYHVSPRQGHA